MNLSQTVRPVKEDDVDNHVMHSEFYEVTEEAAEKINTARANGGRLLCIGTTSMRTIETAADDEGIVHVKKEGGLEKGMHRVGLQQSVLAQYGYMPWDEEWVKNPPVPGSGEGAGKTDVICYYDLELQEGGTQ